LSYIYISQGSVETQTHNYAMAEYIITTLLQTVHWLCWWKNFENRSVTGKDMAKSKVPHFCYGPW